MGNRIVVSAVALAGAIVVMSLSSGSVAAQRQTSAGASRAWAGRTAWGEPDLQGKWEVVETGTPMERPKELANREFLTDEEVAARVRAVSNQTAADDPEVRASGPGAPRSPRSP